MSELNYDPKKPFFCFSVCRLIAFMIASQALIRAVSVSFNIAASKIRWVPVPMHKTALLFHSGNAFV